MAERNLIVLDSTGASEQRRLELVDGPVPYLWIGPEQGATFGCVPDKDVKRLLRYCERILAERKRR